MVKAGSSDADVDFAVFGNRSIFQCLDKRYARFRIERERRPTSFERYFGILKC